MRKSAFGHLAFLKCLPSVVGLVLMTACSMTPSSNIKSQGLYASNMVSAAQGSTLCRTTLQVGGSTGTYVELDGTDEIFCNNIKMSKVNNVANQVWYQATVPYVEGGHYHIRFNRTGETLTADMTMPTQILNAQVDGGTEHQIGQFFSVSWTKSSNGGEVATADLDLNNQQRSDGKLAALSDGAPETGRVIFPADATRITHFNSATHADDQVQGPYTGHVTINRSLPGSMAGAWSGNAAGVQSVSLPVSFK